MKQISGLLPTYSSDEFGICSALYELGGLVVMHDASGCNSTYTTHDEPRWYDMDSMIYVSAISEIEAIMGDDGKLMDDISEVAQELHPAFIAVVGAPIPYMTGTDFPGIAMALQAVMDRFTIRRKEKHLPDEREVAGRRKGAVVNLIGATPLDFAVNGSIRSMKEWLAEHGFTPGASVSLECALEDLTTAGDADANLVVSFGGLAAARLLEEKFGIPYVIGVPIGKEFADHLAGVLGKCVEEGKSPLRPAYAEIHGEGKPVAAIGESVYQASLAAAAAMEQKAELRVLCPVDTEEVLLREGDLRAMEEDDILEHLRNFRAVIADPMYRAAAPEGCTFYALPHEAFSGRIYDEANPNLINRTLCSAGLVFGA